LAGLHFQALFKHKEVEMDRRSFIHPRFVVGTTVEEKVLKLLNGFTRVTDFKKIADRPGFGYAYVRRGYGIGEVVGRRILEARPDAGFTSIRELADWSANFKFRTVIPRFGPDKFSDLVLATIALTPGNDHRCIHGSFRRIDPDAKELTRIMTEAIDVIVYGRFEGSKAKSVVPIQLAETNPQGEFELRHITDDFVELALVGVFRNSGEIFHRSGLIPIQSFPFQKLNYNPILLNQIKGLANADFRESVQAQVGTAAETGEMITRLTSDLKDGFIEMKGEVVAPDTFLSSNNNITFTAHVAMSGSKFTSNGMRDLDSLAAVNTDVLLMSLSIDRSQDVSQNTRNQIANSLREKLVEEALQPFADGTRFLTDHQTVQKVEIDSENITFNTWLTLPFCTSVI
jgi:hypothetical protein